MSPKNKLPFAEISFSHGADHQCRQGLAIAWLTHLRLYFRLPVLSAMRGRFLRYIGSSCAGVALAMTLCYTTVQAATIAVDANSPRINGDGYCSLIEALVNANDDAATYPDCTSGNGADTISLGGKTYMLHTANNSTVSGANGLPVITSPITIEGNGSAITRAEDAPAFRLFEVTSSGVLTLTDMTVTGGFLSEELGEVFGAGIFNNGGAVTLINSTVRDNESVYFGGGICNLHGTLTLLRSTVSGNTTEDDGAGIFNEGGTVTLIASTINHNHANDGEGGGIFNEIDSTITLLNSTISGNQADGGGGGISTDGLLIVRNSTIAYNSTAETGGGIRTRITASTTLERSIIAGNRASEAGNEIYNRISDVGGPGFLIADAFNLFGDNRQSNLAAFTDNGNFAPGATDIMATRDSVTPTALDAILDPVLQNNGGATATHALVPGSPAADGAPSGPLTDQRGLTRARGVNFDIGAFELLPTPSLTQLYLSAVRAGEVGGLVFRDEDILGYNIDTNRWLMVFDGSDVGLGNTDVDAFYFLDDGSLLLSFDQPLLIPTLGVVADADIVHFVADRLGNQTSGRFERYLDGAAVGLDQPGEDIDVISFTADGHLLISTKGRFTVDGLLAHDEDLLAFTPAARDEAGQGAWSLYLDGSDLGLDEASEDISSVSLDHTDLYLTTNGHFDAAIGANRVRGNRKSLLGFAPFTSGENTTGLLFDPWGENLFAFAPLVDELALDFDHSAAANLNIVQDAAADLTDVTFEPAQFALAPAPVAAVVAAAAIETELDEYDSEVDEATPDEAMAPQNHQILLPLISK